MRNSSHLPVAPGPTEDTEGMTRLVPDPIKERLKMIIPLGRFGRIADIEKAAVFLCSDAASLHKRRDNCCGRWAMVGGKQTVCVREGSASPRSLLIERSRNVALDPSTGNI